MVRRGDLMDMLMFQLERNSSKPMYEQLYEGIKKGITEGTIPTESKLPSKRKLAEFLNISQTTIELAYAQLLAEGFIASKPRVGYFVEAVEELAYVEKNIQYPAIPTSLSRETFNIDFNPGQIDTESFPFHLWRKYAKEAIDEQSQELLLIGSPQGEQELREEIATYLYQSRGVICAPNQIVIGSGTEQLMPMIIRLLGPSSRFAIENPGYPLTHHIFKQTDRPAIPINVDNEGLLINDLEHSKANVVYVTPSHQFPTGAVLSAPRRAQLLNWATQKNDRYIIEDDYDSEFRYIGKPIAALQGMDKSDSVIYISTFSKSLMPSLRIAYFVLPPKLVEVYNQAFNYYTSTVPRFEQHILAQFMRDGHFAKHLNRMRKIYRKKLEKLTMALEPFSPTVKISGEQAGMHIVLTISHTKSAAELKDLAQEKGIRIIPIQEYMMDPILNGKPTQFLLGFGGIKDEEINQSVQQLMEAWEIRA